MMARELEIDTDWPQWKQDVAEALNAKGWSMREGSLKAGLGETFARDALKRDREPSATNLRKLYAALGLEADTPPVKAEREEQGDIANLDIRAGMGNGGLLSVMGDDDGYTVADEFINGAWSFPDAVKAVWRNMPETYALPVIGDSMAPTIANGSYAFVDLTYRYPAPEDIYAVDYGDGLMVKRVKLIPQSERVLIMSDNSRYSDDEVRRDDLHVYGRVVAWFHWKG